MSLSETVAAGDRLKSLQALRDRLASQIDGTDSSRDVAALSQRLMDVLAQIDEVVKAQPESKGTVRDEVARKRAERQAGASRSRRSAGRRQ